MSMMDTKATSALLYLDGVHVSFDGFHAINNLSLTLAPGRHTVRVALAGAANAGSKAAETVLDLIEGSTTALKVTLAMKLTKSDVVLTQVDAAAAAQKLSGRTMVTARVP